MRVLRTLALVLVYVGPLLPRPVGAQTFGRVQDIETSIRSAGMGGATTAVGWGEPGPWGNPASLSGTSGLAWLMGTTDLGPGLGGDVKFRSQRMLLGGEGLGFSLMGKPVSGLGSTRLEFVSEGTDPFGNPVTTELVDQVDGWGFGISPIQLLDFFRQRRDPESVPVSRRADISFGYQAKDTELELNPSWKASAGNWDWGVMGSFAVLPGDAEGREARLELGAGYALLNADDQSRFDFGDPLTPLPSARMERYGASAHAVLPFGGAHEQGDEPFGWWSATVPRTVELGFAYDLENVSEGASGPSETTQHLGFEARLMGILAARTGYVGTEDTDLAGWTFGFGLHLPIGPWASFGYDWAKIPVTEGADEVYRHGFAFWLHPVVLWRTTRE